MTVELILSLYVGRTILIDGVEDTLSDTEQTIFLQVTGFFAPDVIFMTFFFSVDGILE